MFLSVLSRRVDSPWKKRAIAISFVVLIVAILSQCYKQYSVIQTLDQLNAADVAEVKIAGRSFSDSESIRPIVDALNETTAYSFGNEGCIPPYQMHLKLTNGDEMAYAIGKSRKKSTILIQPIDGELPSCLFGVTASSDPLLEVLNATGVELLN